MGIYKIWFELKFYEKTRSKTEKKSRCKVDN